MKQVSRLDFYTGIMIICATIWASNKSFIPALTISVIAFLFALTADYEHKHSKNK